MLQQGRHVAHRIFPCSAPPPSSRVVGRLQCQAAKPTRSDVPSRELKTAPLMPDGLSAETMHMATPLSPPAAHGAPAWALDRGELRRSPRANALLTSRIKATTSWEDAFTIFIQFSDVFNAINTACLCHHVAKLTSVSRDLGAMPAIERQDLHAAMSELRMFAESELPSFRPRELANMTYGLARLGLLSRRFMQLVVARSQPKSFNDQELSNVLWAFASAGHDPGDNAWLAACYWELSQRCGSMKDQELCISLWALAKMQRHPGDACLRVLVQELAHRSTRLKLSDLANALWSLVTIGYQPLEAHLEQLLDACIYKADGAPPKHLANLLWAVSSAGWPVSGQWVQAVCVAIQSAAYTWRSYSLRQRGMHKVQGMDVGTQAQQRPRAGNERVFLHNPVASPAVAGQQADHRHWQEQAQPETESVVQLPHSAAVSVMDASMVLQALGWLSTEHDIPTQVVEELLAVMLPALPQSSPQDLVSCMCGLAHLGHKPPAEHMQQLASFVQQQLPDMDPSQVAGALWAFARLKYAVPVSLQRALAEHMGTRLEEYGPQELANVLWAMAKMQLHMPAHLLANVLAALVQCIQPDMGAASLGSMSKGAAHPYSSPTCSADRPHDSSPRVQQGSSSGPHASQQQLRGMRMTSHQEVANGLWAIQRLLPVGHQRGFLASNADLLAASEQLVMHHLLPPDVPRLEYASGLVEEAHVVKLVLNALVKPCPAELVQVAEAFVLMGHTPSKTFLRLHQWHAAKQWGLLSKGQRRRLALMYGRAARGSSVSLGLSGACGSAPCCVLEQAVRAEAIGVN